MNLTTVKQTIGLAFLNSRLSSLLEPLTRPLLSFAYSFRYARWYRSNQLRDKTVATQTAFGRHNRYQLYDYLAKQYSLADDAVTYLEFGVADGSAIKWWVERNQNTASQFVGFDTFEGLPEDWGNVPKGTFSTGGKTPDIPDGRCTFQVGLFHQSLPGFLTSFSAPQHRLMVHIDCDLYAGSLFTLIHLAPFLKKGDIIIFDEFADVMHEFRSFLDFQSATGIHTTVIQVANGGHKMSVIVD